LRPDAKTGNVAEKSPNGSEMHCTRGVVAVLIALLAGCTAQQIRDFQAAFRSAPAPEKLEQCPPQPQPAAITAPSPTPAQRTLTMGVWMYEDGDYGGAENYLQSALSQDTTDAERVRAHKYLAFILCAERREQECRREFREALAIDPTFLLTPAEQGHPTWGPIFRSVKPAASGGR
jgi:Tfp pilus assembly protein PilF